MSSLSPLAFVIDAVFTAMLARFDIFALIKLTIRVIRTLAWLKWPRICKGNNSKILILGSKTCATLLLSACWRRQASSSHVWKSHQVLERIKVISYKMTGRRRGSGKHFKGFTLWRQEALSFKLHCQSQYVTSKKSWLLDLFIRAIWFHFKSYFMAFWFYLSYSCRSRRWFSVKPTAHENYFITL